MMHGRGKSDEAIVAVKPANKAERSAAELVERRAEAKGNARHQSMLRTLCRVQLMFTRDWPLCGYLIVYLIDAFGPEVFRSRIGRGKSLMYGSVRGGARVTRVPTATKAPGSKLAPISRCNLRPR